MVIGKKEKTPLTRGRIFGTIKRLYAKVGVDKTPPTNASVAKCIEKCKRFDDVCINRTGRIKENDILPPTETAESGKDEE